MQNHLLQLGVCGFERRIICWLRGFLWRAINQVSLGLIPVLIANNHPVRVPSDNVIVV